MNMFALTNARGEVVDINNDNLLSFTPTGLGVQFANTYIQHQTYFKATKSTITQGQFHVNIMFGDIESQSYQSFSDFAQFLAYQPLTLTYTTDSGTWYRDGRLNSLTKTEIGGSTVMQVDKLVESFTLEFINNWYNNKTSEYKSYEVDYTLNDMGKVYNRQSPYIGIIPNTDRAGVGLVGSASVHDIDNVKNAYGEHVYFYHPFYVYIESRKDSDEKSLTLINNSAYFGIQDGSPCVVSIRGIVTNPRWAIIQNGNIISEAGFNLTLTDNQKLIVSSYPEGQYARVYNADNSYVDVSQLQDFTKANFIRIPQSESVMLMYLAQDSQVNVTFKEERLLV